MVLGTVLDGGYLPSTVYDEAEEASHEPTCRASGKWGRRKEAGHGDHPGKGFTHRVGQLRRWVGRKLRRG